MGCFDFNCVQRAPGETESDLACTVQFGAETDLFNLRCTWFNKKKSSEMASFLWYNQSRYYGPLIELTSFREKSFFRVTFDTQTIGWLYKNKIAWNWKHLLLGTQVMSEVLYQVFLSHYQIKCLYHRVILVILVLVRLRCQTLVHTLLLKKLLSTQTAPLLLSPLS